MRVLWFTLPFSNFAKPTENYNGGGWVSSLENEIKKNRNIDLGISFFSNEIKYKTIDGVSYYPMNRVFNKWDKLKAVLSMKSLSSMDKKLWSSYEKEMLRVIDLFKPDIIQIFGTEECFGLIANKTKIPVIIHLQGIINPYLNAFLPPSISWKSYMSSSLRIWEYYNKYTIKAMWEAQAEREKEIFKRCNNYIGRTEWDKRITMMMNDKANYYIGNEILRSEFYYSGNRIIPEKLIIISTISSPLYKGYDVILKTANLLKQNNQVEFEWNIYGNIDYDITDKRIKIDHNYVNIHLKGVATPIQLREALLGCTLYVHPSYIDNSPNSLCEAQILGCTVLCTNAGGMSSLVVDSITGFSVPTNDPYQMASLILEIYKNKEDNIKVGNNARDIAQKRHDKTLIIEKLINTYNNLIKSE